MIEEDEPARPGGHDERGASTLGSGPPSGGLGGPCLVVGELLIALSLEEGAHVCQGGLHPDDPEDDLPLLQGDGAVLLALCWGEVGGEGDARD